MCVNNPDFTVEFVTTLLKDLNVSPWIGLQKLSSGELRWVDNNDVTYTNWYQGEPNGGVGAVSIQKKRGEGSVSAYKQYGIKSNKIESISLCHVISTL